MQAEQRAQQRYEALATTDAPDSEEDDDYLATCDINSIVSCSKLLTSEYSRLLVLFGIVPQNSIFDVPNSVLGIGFYTVISILSLKTNTNILNFLSLK